jgi:hypothetical protein
MKERARSRATQNPKRNPLDGRHLSLSVSPSAMSTSSALLEHQSIRVWIVWWAASTPIASVCPERMRPTSARSIKTRQSHPVPIPAAVAADLHDCRRWRRWLGRCFLRLLGSPDTDQDNPESQNAHADSATHRQSNPRDAFSGSTSTQRGCDPECEKDPSEDGNHPPEYGHSRPFPGPASNAAHRYQYRRMVPRC